METIAGTGTPAFQTSHMFTQGGPVVAGKTDINSVICLLFGLKCEKLLFRGKVNIGGKERLFFFK